MEIRLLVLHRKERYAGEYLPEVISVVDEATLDENPEWWTDEKRRQKETRINDETIQAWAEVYVELDNASLMKALYPKKTVQVNGMGTVSE